MIRGIGTDIIEVSRIRGSIERFADRFLERLFTDKERRYCASHPFQERHYAGRFAAKEAIAKALGTGIGADLSWHDMEIVNDAAGKPMMVPSPRLAERLGKSTIVLSISHCHHYATATALWTRAPDE